MILLKEYSNNGFSFFTHAISRKSHEFNVNPNAAMLFYWPVVNRQVAFLFLHKSLAYFI